MLKENLSSASSFFSQALIYWIKMSASNTAPLIFVSLNIERQDVRLISFVIYQCRAKTAFHLSGTMPLIRTQHNLQNYYQLPKRKLENECPILALESL